MASVLLWLLLVQALGLLGFLVAFPALRGLRDRGYGMGKALGLLLWATLAWLLGRFSLLPAERGTLLLLLGALAAVAGAVAWAHRREVAGFLRGRWALLLAEEGVFLLLFGGWLAFRAYHPHIAHTEQPMDLAFLSTSVRAPFFPPEDPWLRGHPVNYYYFGYLMMGLLAETAGVPVPVAYNLSLALVPALASQGLVGLLADLLGRVGAPARQGLALAGLGVVLFGVAGNLEGALEFLRAWGLGSPAFWAWLGVKGLEGPAPAFSWAPGEPWWWWRATRVIDTVVDGKSLDYTIQEFPFFSFLLGDLHPHVMALPFILLVLGLLWALLSSEGPVGPGWLRRNALLLAGTGLAVGALGFVNTWDLPTFLLLALGTVLLRVLLGPGRGRAPAVVGALGLLLAAAFLPYGPFYSRVGGQVPGLALYEGPGTRPLHFALVWGPFLVLLAPFLLREVLAPWRQRLPALAVALPVSLLPLGVWTGLADSPGEGLRLLRLLPGLAAVAVLLARLGEPGGRALLFLRSLLAVAFLLLVGMELFFVRDPFGTRMNTVFKGYYQVWVLLSVATPPALFLALRGPGLPSLRGEGARWAWGAVAGLALGASLAYPAAALPSKAGGFRGEPTLDGLAYLQREAPGEYEAIRWLWATARPGEGLVEAVGPDYSPFGRVAAATGLPTVLAWPGHQVQWRRGSRLLDGRAEDVHLLYTTRDIATAWSILEKYRIRYLLVGERERRAYGTQGLSKFPLFLERAFEAGGMTIYWVRE